VRLRSYKIPDLKITEDVFSKLQSEYHLAFGRETRRSRQYLDTFDWSLYQKGVVFTVEQVGATLRLRWEDRDGSPVRSLTTQGAKPQWMSDLPAGPFREKIGALLDNRALLTQAVVDSTEKDVRILNKDKKTIARFVHQKDVKITDPVKERSVSVQNRLLLVPVRGYEKVVKRLEKSCLTHLAALSEKGSVLEEGLQMIGRPPGDYSSKVIVDLDPDMEAGVAINKVLSALFNVILLNEPGMRSDIDVEFLHDFRVAVRRTRTILGEFKPLFSHSILEFFRTEFKWLGTITGPTRDLDVYGIKIEQYRKELPPAMTGHLDAFATFVETHQAIEQKRMVRALDTPRYPDLINRWQQVLDAPPADGVSPSVHEPVIDVVSTRIWKRYRRAIKLGHVVVSGKNPEAFHTLRLVCKKLRYLMEFFRSLYPKERIVPLINTLKRFQDNLGDIQDYTVQQQMLPQFAAQMTEEGVAPSETLLAMGWLAGHLREQQQHAQADFARQFHRFARPKKQQQFRKLFYSPVKSDAKT